MEKYGNDKRIRRNKHRCSNIMDILHDISYLLFVAICNISSSGEIMKFKEDTHLSERLQRLIEEEKTNHIIWFDYPVDCICNAICFLLTPIDKLVEKYGTMAFVYLIISYIITVTFLLIGTYGIY
jgi:hypothetical protein